MANVKGTTLTSRMLWVEQHHGVEGVHRLLAALRPATRAVVEGQVLKSNWYPFEAFVDLNVTVDRVFGRGDLGLVKGLGRFGADVNLTTIYRLFYMVGSVNWLIDRAAALWSVNYDSGRLAVDHLDERAAELHVLEFATPHRAHCLSVMGWAERSLELSGARLIESVEPACRVRGHRVCTFRMTWR
jgi:hypothetical protein